MKIMLIDPPQFQISPMISNARLPSSGLLAINSYMNSLGHEVCFLDCKNKGLYFEDIRNALVEFQPEVIGVTAFTLDIYSAMISCMITKEVLPNAVTVVGGYHASAAPELTLYTCPQVDYCTIGESELTFSELLNFLGNDGIENTNSLEKIPGLAFRHHTGNVYRTPPRRLIDNMDSLPLTYLDNLDLKLYHFPITTKSMKRRVGFGLSFSRGCRFNCKYCSNYGMWHQKWRSFSPKRMLDEIWQIHDKYGKSNFFFCDNDFLMDQRRLESFLDHLERSGLSIQWTFETSTANAIRFARFFPRMKQLGLYMCMVGFEFASSSRLTLMGKNIGSLEKSIKAAKILREAGVLIFALGIIGFPDETKESIREYVEFFTSLQPDMVYTQFLTPLPGTQIFNEFHNQNKISTYDFSKYDLLTPVLKYDFGSIDDIEKWHQDASELLFTPLCMNLYTEFRRNKISLQELSNRYAHMSHSMHEYNRGQIKFNQVLQAYQRSILERNAIPFNNINVSTRKEFTPPNKREKIIVNQQVTHKLKKLEEQWKEIMGEEFAPIGEEEQKIILQHISKKLPMDEIQKIRNRKIEREDLITLWLNFMQDDGNRREVLKEVKARREWELRIKKLLVEQNKYLEICFPRTI